MLHTLPGSASRPRRTKRRRSPCALVFVLCAAAGAFAQPAAATPPKPPHLFEKATPIPEPPPGVYAEPDAFEFEQSGYRYRVAANGAGRRTKGDAVRRFNLRLAGGDRITRLYFSGHEGNVLLVGEVSDGESGAGFVARLEQPSMRALWKAELPAFNVGPPLREGPHLYLTAVGFVAKLDLETGQFVWRNGRLYGRGGRGTFNSFVRPEVGGGAVLFREVPADSRPAKTLRVDRKTGKILSIE